TWTAATSTSNASCRAWARGSAASTEADTQAPGNRESERTYKKGPAMQGPGHMRAAGFGPGCGSVDGGQLQVDVVLAIPALQNPRRRRQAIHDPGDDFALAVPAHHARGLVRFAADLDGFFAGDLEGLVLDPAVLDQAVVEWLARGHVAHQDQVHQHAVEIAGAQFHRPRAIVLDVAGPARFAAVPVVVGGHCLALDQHRREAAGAALAVDTLDRAPLLAVDFERGALFQLGAHAADVDAVFPTILANAGEGHLRGRFHAHVIGLVIGAECFDRERGRECQC